MIINKTPTESKFGLALISYLISDANPHTSFVGANLRFVENHPEEKLSVQTSQGVGVLTLFSFQRRYLTRAIGEYSFGLAIYATNAPFARSIRENVVEALGVWTPDLFAMDGQYVTTLEVKNQVGPLWDKTGLQVAEVSFVARLASGN